MTAPITVTLILDDTEYTGKINAAGQKADDLGKKLQKASTDGGNGLQKLTSAADSLKGKMEALTTIVLGMGFLEMSSQALKLADNIIDLSKSTDISVERILQLREAFNAAGGNADGLGKILNTLNVLLYDAQEGVAGAQEALIKLGFSFSDMANLGTDKALQKVIDKLAGITDPIERNALAFKTLGKEAKGIDWEGIKNGTTTTNTEMVKYAEAIKKAGEAHDKLQQAGERLTIAFASLLEKTGVLDFINGLDSSMAALEKKIALVGIAIGLYFGASFVATMAAAAASVRPLILSIEGLFVALQLVEKGTAIGRILSIIAVAALAVGSLVGLNKLLDEMSKPKLDQGTSAMEAPSTPKPAVTPAWAKEIAQLDQLSESYKRANNDLLNRINLETSMLGVAESRAKKEGALADMAKEYSKQLAELDSKLKQEQLSPQSAARDARISQIRKEREEITALYEIDKQRLSEAYDQNIKLNEQLKQANNLYESQNQLQSRLRKIQDDVNNIGLSDRERKYRSIAQSSREAANAQILEEEKLLGFQRNAITGEFEKIKLGQERKQQIIDIYAAQAQEEEAAAKASDEYARQFSSGWKQAFAEYADNASNAAKQAARIFEKFTQGMEDAIVNFAKTGKFEWKNFLASMVEELLRSNIRQLMSNVFAVSGMSGGGGGGGSILGGLWDSIFGRAIGGPVQANQPYIVGERGPELFVPASAGQVVANGALSSTPASTTVVNYNINAVDAPSFKAMIAKDPSFIYAVSMMGAKTMPGAR